MSVTVDGVRARADGREAVDLVVVGHVDHGKSTVIGRLMADTGSLPDGKLDAVRDTCARNARPFEYAFLLDALKSEQAQGITIDTARCFFDSGNRRYVIHDAPGHIEFLKNAVTGASRAQAALLVIDAGEGVRENSRRHGYILSMLGVESLAIVVNKMDLVGYDREVFERIRDEYAAFLEGLGVVAESFIPAAAMEGENIATRSEHTPWYEGPTVLEQIDAFRAPSRAANDPFRMPVQDVYKFTARGDDRRIVAGTAESGHARPGDDVVFWPSGKRSSIESIEAFSAGPRAEIGPDMATGVMLSEQVYVRPGELMTLADEDAPQVGQRFRATLFWMSRAPMVSGTRYVLRVGAARVPAELVDVEEVLDASDMRSAADAGQVERHDVGTVILETARPIAFDLSTEAVRTSRFVIVDDHQIAACGIVLEAVEQAESLLVERARRRELSWESGRVDRGARQARYRHSGKAVVLAFAPGDDAQDLARSLEERLFMEGAHTYYLSLANVFEGGDALGRGALEHVEDLHRLGESMKLMTDAGLIVVTAIADVDGYDLATLRVLNAPNELFVVDIGSVVSGDFEPQVTLAHGHDRAEAEALVIRELNAMAVLPEYDI